MPHRRWCTTEANKYRARELRRAMTPAEKKLWRYICDNQLGVQFRRQHAVGPYIVDFFCARRKLVVEVDGDTHANPMQPEYDAERTQWLNEQKNYCVVRFWNDDVIHNIESVLRTLSESVSKTAIHDN